MKVPDPKLLALFEAEQREHLETVRSLLETAAAGPGLAEIFRCVHTLKGAARAVGIGSTERLAHRLETLFAQVRDNALALDRTVLAAIRRTLDTIEDVLAAVIENREEPDVSAALQAIEDALGEGGSKPAPLEPLSVERPSPPAPPEPLATRSIDTVRVSAESVDALVRSSSQVLATGARQLDVARQVDGVHDRIREIQREWERVRQQAVARLRKLSAAPAVLESLDFVDSRLQSLESQARGANLAQQRSAWALNQLGGEVYRDACRVRMTPAETVFDPFRKMVRELAASEGKEVEFRAQGMDVYADRLVLQRLKDPVMHLLRNAVSHGIERPEERIAAGKPRAGVVELRLEVRGGRLNVIVEDDGNGIDFQKVAELAASRGLLPKPSAGQVPGLPRDLRDLVKFILQPGFSTSSAVTNLAGRGMGLSVVHDQVIRLHGDLSFPETRGTGTSVLISAPLSISTEHVVLVACGSHTFAIPSQSISRLCRVRSGAIENVAGGEAIRVGERPVPLARLADLAGLPASGHGSRLFKDAGHNGGYFFVVVLGSGNETAGIVVDEILDEREAVVQDLKIPGAMEGMSTGGLPLEDGTVAVALNPLALVGRIRQTGPVSPLRAIQTGAQEQEKVHRILVVDDSITTRSLEKSILETHGYQVRVAVDGVEALDQLRMEPADLVITDLLMPRMDGFQLLDCIKRDKQFCNIPVIIVSSLDQRQDRERGLSLGANAYIVKQKFDQRELLDAVRQIL